MKEISSISDPLTQQVNNSQRTQSQWSLQKLLDQRQAVKPQDASNISRIEEILS